MTLHRMTPPEIEREEWRGKVRVFEFRTRDKKYYGAEYRSYWSPFPWRGWRAIAPRFNAPHKPFESPKDAADAAKAEWERLESPRVQYRRKVWP